MTVAAFPAGTIPTRPAWRSLLWTVPITALWTLLIYWQPGIPASGVPVMALRLMVHVLIAIGLCSVSSAPSCHRVNAAQPGWRS